MMTIKSVKQQESVQESLQQIVNLLSRHKTLSDTAYKPNESRQTFLEHFSTQQHTAELQKKLDSLHEADVAYILEALPREDRLLTPHHTATQYLHRNYFARAALDPRLLNPLHSPFAPSFLATYRSAVLQFKLMSATISGLQQIAGRIDSFWSVTAMCAVSTCGSNTHIVSTYPP